MIIQCSLLAHIRGKILHRLRIPSVLGTVYLRGRAVAQRLKCCATNRKVAVSIPAGVNGFFIDIKFFPGVDSASNRNEYREHFLGVKAAGA